MTVNNYNHCKYNFLKVWGQAMQVLRFCVLELALVSIKRLNEKNDVKLSKSIFIILQMARSCQ